MNDYAELVQKFIESFEVVAVPRYLRLDVFTLLANPPGEGVSRLLQRISKDQGQWETLIPNGYIPFGRGTDFDYDPVCFDVSSRKKRDYRIVKIDHEEILCNYRI